MARPFFFKTPIYIWFLEMNLKNLCGIYSLHNYYSNRIRLTFFLMQENCNEVILSTDTPFRRLDHYKIHEYTKKWNMSQRGQEPISMTMTTSIDAMFKRKRGRPPKNRVIEVIIIFTLREEWDNSQDHKEGSNWAKFLCGINMMVK